jgi:hypothetical protein
MIKESALAFSLVSVATLAQAGIYSDSTLNNSFASAANINPYFTTEFSPDIGDLVGNDTSLKGPWVTITGQGNGASDFFSFDVNGATNIALDVDYTFAHPDNPNGFDAVVALWQQINATTYSLLDWNDDRSISAGAAGSVHMNDSFLEKEVSSGHYVAGIAHFFFNAPSDTGWTPSSAIAGDRQYTLQVQVTPIPEPETYAVLTVGLGLIGFMTRRKNAVG